MPKTKQIINKNTNLSQKTQKADYNTTRNTINDESILDCRIKDYGQTILIQSTQDLKLNEIVKYESKEFKVAHKENWPHKRVDNCFMYILKFEGI